MHTHPPGLRSLHPRLGGSAFADTVPVSGLFVHPANRRAIGLYQRLGFQDFYLTSKGEDPNVLYGSMILDLSLIAGARL
jgi:ribosomal protein S18 acetylase RimI-like enzyme